MWWRPIMYGILMWTVAVYAFRRGGRDERLATIGMILGSYLSVLVIGPHETFFQQVETEMATVDACLFLLLWCIGLWSIKFWPLWLAAIQGVTVLAHAAPLMPTISPFASSNAVSLWGYPMWVILAFAVRQHHRNRTRSVDGLQKRFAGKQAV